MFKNAGEVIKFIREKDIKMVDFKMVDESVGTLHSDSFY